MNDSLDVMLRTGDYLAGRRDTVDDVLEIIDEKNKRIYIEHRKHGAWERGYTDALDELEEAVKALKGGEHAED